MAKLIPLPTRVISDIEELRPMLTESLDYARTLSGIAALAQGEREIATDLIANLKTMVRIVNRMRSREQDIVQDAQATAPAPER